MLKNIKVKTMLKNLIKIMYKYTFNLHKYIVLFILILVKKNYSFQK